MATENPVDDEVQADRYRAPALDKGLDILEILARQAHGLTRSEIVREMGRSPSEIYRMLERLVARGYVTRLDGGDRYALTMKLFLLAHHYPPLRRMAAEAQPLMHAFALETRQSCHLVMPETGTGIVIAQAGPQAHWEFRVRIGAQLDLFTTGSGQTLLAFQHPDRRDDTLAQWGISGADKRLAEISGHLQAVRDAGYREAPSGQLVGVVDLSVPVLGPDGDAFAVLTCAYIRHLDEDGPGQRAEALAKLLTLGARLSFAPIAG
ncbi:IclR family transcriptional regulator [Paracoccus sp. M683]|uniref:IclR family transcriptional regulator n=1 Tax=Paracoccus sp. M683 TaxID=2594268 RepID=UPI00117E6251|nr:IclR family transcriptional regulator [Paracoccus sp. M683]TRW96612.1 IclR family transcriptional regulator [Paracoccus sp. M683]